jgi:hypothetical protein
VSLLTAFLAAPLIAGLRIEGATAQPADTRKALIAAWRCPLSGQLEAAYKNPSGTTDDERFFVISVHNNPKAFVRCRFASDNRKLHCEASRAYYKEGNAHPLYVLLPRDRTEALTRLGFAAAGPAQNLSYDKDLPATPDFDAIVTFMLTALHDGFGVCETTELDVVAPFQGAVVTACRR